MSKVYCFECISISYTCRKFLLNGLGGCYFLGGSLVVLGCFFGGASLVILPAFICTCKNLIAKYF